MEKSGALLRDLRSYRSRAVFADLVCWTAEQVRNLETGRTRLQESHLEELIQAGQIVRGDRWHRSFLEALENEYLEERAVELKSGERAYILREVDLRYFAYQAAKAYAEITQH